MWEEIKKIVPRVLNPGHLKTNRMCEPVPNTYKKPTMIPPLVHLGDYIYRLVLAYYVAFQYL